MEFEAISKRVGTIATVFDEFDERPIDCDFMLPDYLPDITAVLKCVMKPMVQSYQISGDRVTADGTAYLTFLYLDEDRRCVHSCECSNPFTSVFTVKGLKSSDVLRLSARVNYVNCRATSPRRVDVHGAFSVGLTVMSEVGQDAVCAVACEDLFTRTDSVSGSVVSAQAQKTVSLNEVVDLGAESAEILVRNTAEAVITECRQLPDKAIVKGDVLLETVYVSAVTSGTVCKVCNTIPFSQILDIDGLTEDAVCDCRVQVIQSDARLMQDPGGENRLLSVAIKLMVWAECYCTETYEVVTDAYHTSYAVQTESDRLETCCVEFIRSDAVTTTLTGELPDGDIHEIVDLWCEPVGCRCVCEEQGAVFSGDMLVSMITRDSEGVLSYYERVSECRAELSECCEEMKTAVTLLGSSYQRNGSLWEMHLSLSVKRVGFSKHVVTAVTRMSMDDSVVDSHGDLLDGCCLKVCFATAGESVWELARRERTSPDSLKAENGLTRDVLEKDCMLLIPMK